MRRSESSLAALLLVSRIVESPVPPLKASEFWALLDRVGDPATLLDGSSPESTERIVALLDRATALAFELERLDHAGVSTVSPFDDEYPVRWRERLGTAAPPLVHAVGPLELLQRGGLAIVGSRDVDTNAADVAKQAAALAAEAGQTVISGGARGTDLLAMGAALAARGNVVGVLADALVKAVNDPDVRRAINDEQLCFVSPYSPTAPFSAGNAMGRNKLIYALADVTFVVASDDGKGGTWAGATEALKKHYGTVAVWTGAGAGPGNAKIVAAGATAIDDVAQVASVPTHPVRERETADHQQLPLEI